MKIASLNNKVVCHRRRNLVTLPYFNWAFYYRQVPVTGRCQSTSDLSYVLLIKVLLKSEIHMAFGSLAFII